MSGATVTRLTPRDAANLAAIGDAWGRMPYGIQLAVGAVARRIAPGVYAGAPWHELTPDQCRAVVSALSQLSDACDSVTAALERATA